MVDKEEGECMLSDYRVLDVADDKGVYCAKVKGKGGVQ